MIGDSLVVITTDQATIINLVFNDNERLQELDKERQKQIESYKEAIMYSLELDSIHESRISNYKKEVKSLNKKVKVFKNISSLLGTTTAVFLALLFIL